MALHDMYFENNCEMKAIDYNNPNFNEEYNNEDKLNDDQFQIVDNLKEKGFFIYLIS